MILLPVFQNSYAPPSFFIRKEALLFGRHLFVSIFSLVYAVASVNAQDIVFDDFTGGSEMNLSSPGGGVFIEVPRAMDSTKPRAFNDSVITNVGISSWLTIGGSEVANLQVGAGAPFSFNSGIANSIGEAKELASLQYGVTTSSLFALSPEITRLKLTFSSVETVGLALELRYSINNEVVGIVELGSGLGEFDAFISIAGLTEINSLAFDFYGQRTGDGNGYGDVTMTRISAVIPEPSSFFLCVAGASVLFLIQYKRKRCVEKKSVSSHVG